MIDSEFPPQAWTEVVVTAPQTPGCARPPETLDDVVVIGQQAIVRWDADDLDSLLVNEVGDVIERLLERLANPRPPVIRLNGQRVADPAALEALPSELLASATLRETADGPEIALETSETYAGWRASGRMDVAELGARRALELGYASGSPDRIVNAMIADNRTERQSDPAWTANDQADRERRVSFSFIHLADAPVQRSVSGDWRSKATRSGGAAGGHTEASLSYGQTRDLSAGGTWQALGSISGSRVSFRDATGNATAGTSRRLLAETRFDGLRPFGQNIDLTALTAVTFQVEHGVERNDARALAELGIVYDATPLPLSAKVTFTSSLLGATERTLDLELRWRPSERMSLTGSLLSQIAPPSYDLGDTRRRFAGTLRWDNPASQGQPVDAFVGADNALASSVVKALGLVWSVRPFEDRDLEFDLSVNRRHAVDPIVTLNGEIDDWATLFPDRIRFIGEAQQAFLGPFNLASLVTMRSTARVRYAMEWPASGGTVEVTASAAAACDTHATTRDDRRIDADQLGMIFGLRDTSGQRAASFSWRGQTWSTRLDYLEPSERSPLLGASLEKRVRLMGADFSFRFGADNVLGPARAQATQRRLFTFEEAPRLWFEIRRAAAR